MKIGILQCDDVLEKFQPEFGTYPSMLINLFHSVQSDIDFVVFDVRDNQYPSHHSDCDAYITTGSRHGVNDKLPWLPAFLEFIKTLHQHKHPCIGICYGHQAVAKALGGEVSISDKGWGVGLSVNTVVSPQPWMQPTSNPLRIIVTHKEQVIQLPEEAELICSSSFCHNYMFQVGSHFLCVQGHPEFSKSYSKALMNHRRDQIPVQVVNDGIQSLEYQADDITLAKWILNFINLAII